MPPRARDLARALATFGITVEAPRSGSHWTARRGSVSYSIPMHNGMKTEVKDPYIRGVCRAFGLDEDELRRLL